MHLCKVPAGSLLPCVCTRMCHAVHGLSEMLITHISTHMYILHVKCQEASHCHTCAHTCVTPCTVSEMLIAHTCIPLCEVPAGSSLPHVCVHMCHAMHGLSKVLIAHVCTHMCIRARCQQAPPATCVCTRMCQAVHGLGELFIAHVCTHVCIPPREVPGSSSCPPCAHTRVSPHRYVHTRV